MQNDISLKAIARAPFMRRCLFASSLVAFLVATLALVPSFWIRFLPAAADGYREQCVAGLVLVRVALAAGAGLSLLSLFCWKPGEGNGIERIGLDRWDFVFAMVFFLLAAAIRFYPLHFSLWWDELTNVLRYIRRGYPVIFTFSGGSNNHILNSAMVRFVFDLFGEGEVQMRLPAYLLGSLTPAIAYLALKREFGRFSATAVALWLAIHITMFKHATEARGYAGALLCVVLSHYLVVHTARNRSYGSAVAYVAVCVLGFGFLPTFLLIPFAHGVLAVLLLLWSFWKRTAMSADQFQTSRHIVFVCLWSAVMSFVVFGFSLPQSLHVVSRDLEEEFRALDWLLFGDVCNYMSGLHWYAGSAVFAGLAILGSLRFRRHPMIIVWLFPLILAGLWLFYPGSRVVPRTLYFVLPSLLLPASLGLAALLNGRVLWKLTGAVIVVAVLLSTLVQLSDCFRIGNPDLKGISQKYADASVVLVGPQADVNVYYFPQATVLRNGNLEPTDLAVIRAADVVVRGCTAEAAPDNMVTDCGFRLQELLPSWHPSRPTCFQVYVKRQNADDPEAFP